MVLLEALREDLFPCLLHFLEAAHTPCLVAPSSIFTACTGKQAHSSHGVTLADGTFM